MNYTTNNIHNGAKIILNNDPYAIVSNEMIKPGKGQAFNRIKIRNLKTGRVIEKTFKSGEVLQAADVLELTVQYLYNDGTDWYFMNTSNFEQYIANATIIADAKQWLIENNECVLTLWNNEPLSIAVSNFVELIVTDTDPGLKGDTVSTGGKSATLNTGAVIRVPLFINIGDIVKVDTRIAEYISRVKNK